jgi:NAD(P)-dependent dehydrogenase (short-subunit alcohol dehydrogenase family)
VSTNSLDTRQWSPGARGIGAAVAKALARAGVAVMSDSVAEVRTPPRTPQSPKELAGHCFDPRDSGEEWL